jgi:hypothetical protein
MPIRAAKKTPIKRPAARRAVTPRGTALAAFTPIMLDVPYVRQEQDEWCWAACSQMVAGYLGNPDVKQCELANFLHGQTDCCAKPGSLRCNQPSPYEGIGLVYQHLQINCVSEPHAETVQVMVRELNARRPVEVGYLWSAGGGHVAIVRGVTAQGLFAVNDPWFGTGAVTYLALLTAYGGGQWAMSFGDFRKL